MYTKEELDQQMEDAVGELYKVFFRMRGEGLYQEEYDAMGTLLNILMEDRQHLRNRYKDKINV